MKRLIKNQVTDRVVMLGDWIPLRMARAPVTAANYNYVNASRVPAHGEITTTGVQLRINNVDSDGVDHGAYLSHVKIGDTVTINGQSATITTDPIWTSSGYWYFDVDAWPFMADGNYEVTITYHIPSYFSPADLFASGEQGAWYDPSDFSTMFQDSAGTTPVTAVGQSVGKINDKSGRNNHAIQATAAARPVLRQDPNSKYYLDFDGVDDCVSSSRIQISSLTGHATVCGVTYVSESNARVIDSDGTFVRVSQQIRIVPGASVISFNNAGTPFSNAGPSLVAGPNVLRQQTTASSVESFANGSGNGSTAVTGTLPTGTEVLKVGGFSDMFSGSIGQVVHINRPFTAQEISDVETFVADKTGVTL